MLLAFFFLLSPTARMSPDAESCINRQGLCQITIGHGLAWANCHPPTVAYETSVCLAFFFTLILLLLHYNSQV